MPASSRHASPGTPTRQLRALAANRSALRTGFKIAALLTLSAVSARAATLSWDGGTTTPTGTAGDGLSQGGAGTWTTDPGTTNWDPGASGTDIAWTNGNTAVFGGTGDVVNLGSPISALGVQFTAGGYTITPSATNTLTLTSAGTGTASAIFTSGTGITNSIGSGLVVGNAGNTTANFSVSVNDTLNLAGTITQTNLITAGLTLNGGGTINYSGTGFAPGKFNVQGGSVFNSSGTMTISNNGTYTGVSDILPGSTWNITAGAVTAATTLFLGNGAGTSGALNISGGTASFSAINVGSAFSGAGDSTGTLTISGTGALTSTGVIRLGSAKSGVGTLNLNGGSLTNGSAFALAAGATGTGGTGTFNFNGGTLTASGNGLAIPATITTNVRDGGAIINTGTFATTIAANLVKSTLTGDAGTGVLTKQGTGTLTLSGVNTYAAAASTTNSTIIAGGTLVSANPQALGAGRVGFTAGATTLDLATDGSDAANNVSIGSNFNTTTSITVASDVKTGGVGINHTLGSLAFGNSTLNVTRGPNVTSGNPSITFGAVNLSAGGTTVGTATFNPTTADMIVTSTVSPSTVSKTLDLDGTSAGNRITGNIQGTGAVAILLAKSNTSTWTLTGSNTFVGATTVTGGVLVAAGTGTNKALGGTASIAVNAGTLLLSTANQVNVTAGITMGTATPTSGILSVAANANQGTASRRIGNAADGATSVAGLGAFTLNSTATLAYNGAATTLVFGLFTPNGNVLNVTGYTNGTATSNAQNSGAATDDRLIFSGAQAATTAFAFNGNAAGFGVTEILLDSGFYEVAFTAVPEPGTWACGLFGLGMIGFTQRRRLGAWLGTSRQS